MVTEMQARQETTCRGCSGPKDVGCVVCWTCFKRLSPVNGVEPFKYAGMELDQWLAAIETAKKPPTAIRIVCDKCGSDNVVRDATAAWSVELQQWELAGVQDAGYCNECDSRQTLVEIPITGDAAPAIAYAKGGGA